VTLGSANKRYSGITSNLRLKQAAFVSASQKKRQGDTFLVVGRQGPQPRLAFALPNAAEGQPSLKREISELLTAAL